MMLVNGTDLGRLLRVVSTEYFDSLSMAHRVI